MVTTKEQLFIEFAKIDWEDLGGGVRRKVMAYGDQLMAVYVEFKRGAVGARHSHPHLQITYVQSGAFQTYIGEQTKVLRGGDFYYIPANIAHGVEALEDGVLIDFFTPMREEFVPRA